MKAPMRIVVFGPESTGKTSLAAKLAGHFGEPWSAEYVRQYWDEHKGTIGPGDLEAVGRGQLRAEAAAASKARRLYFCDTDLLTCTLWNDLLFPGACPPRVREEAEAWARKTDLYLLCGTDIPFEPDPQRCFPDPEGRAMCMRLWRETLENRSLPRREVSGPWNERFDQALAAVERLMARGENRA
jgi:HTH-type transcriptional regulator, transcriptional repressor of NAD biosynthesis genes